MASHLCCTPSSSPAAEPTPRPGLTFLPSLWTLYPVCIMLDCRKPISSLQASPSPQPPIPTLPAKRLPKHFSSENPPPIPITRVYPGAYILVPALFPHGFNLSGNSSYFACCWSYTRPVPLLVPFVPPLLVRGPGIFLGRSSLPFWTTSVYRIFSEF